MRTRPAPRTFRSGELAPWLDGITNELTQAGCRTLENFIVRKQGQITRRPGTFFVNEVKDSADATVLVPVTIDDDNSYVLELGDEYIRFYKNHARITYTGTTTIYEVTSPWSTGDVSDLRWSYDQNNKAMIFSCGGTCPLKKLSWVSDADWTLNDYQIYPSRDMLFQDRGGRIIHSADGEQFQNAKIKEDAATIWGIAYGKQNLLAVGTSIVNLSSGDLDLWVQVSDKNYSTRVAGNEFGEFIATSGTSLLLYSSDDGLTFTEIATGNLDKLRYAVTYSPLLRAWKTGGASVTEYSFDPSTTWTSITFSGHILDIAENGTLWVACGNPSIYYSASTAAPWSIGFTQTGTTWEGIAHGKTESGDLWLAAGGIVAGGGGRIYASTNGMTWTSAISGTMNNFQAVAFHGHLFYILQSLNTTSSVPYLWVTADGVSYTTLTINLRGVLGTKSAIKTDWNNIYEYFDSENHYPKNLCFHEGRLILGPTDNDPATIWASKVNHLENYYLGEFSDEAWSYKISSERNVDIQWMMGGLGGIVVGTRTAEGIMLGSQEEGITPNTAQFRWLSTFGSANIQPVRVNNAIVFIQRGGEIVRGYIPQANAYESPELTFFADHIGKGGLTSIDRQEDPQNIVYFTRTDGQLAALTMETGLIAWTRIKPASTSLSVGIVESIAVIPTGGAEDEVWQVVNRKVSAGTKRYIEYYDSLAVSSLADAHYVDCGVNPTSTVTFANVGALTHLAGEIVDALIDGTRWVSGLTVAAAGTIAITPYSGTNIHAGLPYRSYLQTMRGDYGSPWGDGAGLNKRTNDLLVWVHDSSALATFGPTTTAATEVIAYPSSTTLVTDVVKVNFPGQWDRDNYIWCIITDPRPFTLVAMAPDSETGDR
jgi:hypothetical protein